MSDTVENQDTLKNKKYGLLHGSEMLQRTLLEARDFILVRTRNIYGLLSISKRVDAPP